MKYKAIIANYPPYCLLKDKRGYITKLFGSGHTGVDSIGNQWDNPVASWIDGICVCSYSETCGNIATVTSSNYRVKVVYMHLKNVATSGDVKARQQIGIEGSTGTLSTGKHLHISLYIDGKLVNPLLYLQGKQKLPLDPVITQPQSNVSVSTLNYNKKEGSYMIKKVISPLNLRSTRSLANDNNIVYRNMPNGTIFLVTATKAEGGKTWGHVFVVLGGKSYVGWANMAATWSVEV